MSLDKGEAIRVLVVDDSASMRQTLAKMLEDFAYQVETADDGEAGLEKFRTFAPNIILLDMKMPRLDGLGVIRHIRSTLGDQNVLIIMVTSEDSPDVRLKAFTLGVNDYLNKPFDRAELLARVAVAARQVRLNRRLRTAFEHIDKEIDHVAELQNKLLPYTSPSLPGVEIQNLYKPSGKASGDYFDYFPLADGTLRAVVADVSGHGARAAFIMGMVRALIRITRRHYMGLADTFALINAQLCEIIGQEPDFLTIMAADFDFETGKLSYLNAGHCPGLLRLDDGSIQRLAPTSTVLGFFDIDFTPRQADLTREAGLFMFTDGFYDWEVEPGKRLDFEGFWDLAVDAASMPGNYLVNLMGRLRTLSDQPAGFRDDLTALWISMRPDAAKAGAQDRPDSSPAPGRAAGQAVGQADRRIADQDECRPRRFGFTARAMPEAARRLAKSVMAVLAEDVRDEAALYEMDLALTEACANVAMHAYPPGGAGDLDITLDVDPGRSVAVEVADSGPGFHLDLNSLSEPEPTAESGRGMYIINKLMDSLAVRREKGRNIVRFTKNIGKESWKDCE